MQIMCLAFSFDLDERPTEDAKTEEEEGDLPSRVLVTRSRKTERGTDSDEEGVIIPGQQTEVRLRRCFCGFPPAALEG